MHTVQRIQADKEVNVAKMGPKDQLEFVGWYLTKAHLTYYPNEGVVGKMGSVKMLSYCGLVQEGLLWHRFVRPMVRAQASTTPRLRKLLMLENHWNWGFCRPPKNSDHGRSADSCNAETADAMLSSST